MYTIADISGILVPTRSIVIAADAIIQSLIYDTRKIVNAETGLFFALINRRDGHQYIKDAYLKGVRNFVLQEDMQQEFALPDANILWVSDTFLALQSLAAYQRSKFKFPVLGITGSNGKTIVKEWLYQLMSPDYKIYRSPKSYNSQLGVALSLWELNDQYNFAIIEAGISEVGEMAKLEQMIKPTHGLLTNIGIAHKSGFESKQEKIAEKLKLFTHAEALIYPQKYLENIYIPSQIYKFAWGEDESCQLEIYSVKRENDQSTLVSLCFSRQFFTVKIPFVDQASIENAISCIAVMISFGYDFKVIAARIALLQPMEMRLELKKGKQNSSIIDDSYSNDLVALQIALDFLKQQKQHQRKILILSDIPGVQLNDEKSITKLRRLIAESELTELIFVGPILSQLLSQFALPIKNYADTKSFIEDLKNIDYHDATVLIKGAREYHFEQISKRLVAKSHDTTLEINLNALEHNLNVYRSLLPAGVKLMAMVKAFSYGSGSFEIANLLQFNHVDYLTVAFADEGVDLRNGGITLPIVVMSPDESAFDAIVHNNLEPEIYSFRILASFLRYLEQHDLKNFPVHIKVDTGMHRLGFMPDEIDSLLDILKNQKAMKVQSVFSHLASAGNARDNQFTEKQITLLDAFTKKLQHELGYTFIRHIAATSGIDLWPSAYFDMVRLGIGLYGIDMDRADLPVQEVSVLKTNVTQIKFLPETETVGYNRAGKLSRPSRIATIKIGYADGYDRRFGNGIGKMSINGQLVATIGHICMDMCMLDVTDIDVQEEDEVIVYPDLKEAALAIGTIPYELLVNISQRVKRVYFYE
ncbi:bifunctional UDP-N-acetylmuramoyl-tripeptide:D-alanyl-D-alanine ligase/alanine racemase [Sphingobacterium sp. SRCM116780]|uniref:bifunctional UDP-N-acetylmuramoyl-tripeptide:D-alanyl-D-alanine ligase/alanine racemase n=1 Tax=Sphingobacterium sp. SRCM116780 TaxID=2907623 RepID=UPI001F2161EB|nr:bifunctional UDP-N-acetylmuramoyl-tripeptide:D-alanyl-D-alanine ligase/alanine racemase [Sphingobacterium sp. SRCM116780]UIR56912.1 bifunctional UDP-N-acetylmuramoyl-tripeptide:D-alanyl-D-alanine ligase/alanine racemase [Sphingobacterium sp. SRCM116780]